MGKAKRNEIDMLNGPMTGKLIKMAMPLAAISILQQLFNAADVAVVGRFASDTAMAAVGANTPVINMFITLMTGIATGGNVTISTLIGEGKHDRIKDAVHTVFSISLVGGVLIVLIGQIIARPILNLINVPDDVIDQSVIYLRIYLFAMMFAVIYNFASAILRSKGDTRRPLYCLIASGIINVILNLIFVIGFSLDVVGVAVATLIANFVCALSTVIILMKEDDFLKLSLKDLGFDKELLKFTLHIGLPAGLQGMTFSISNIIIQSGINSFGADCIAGNTAALNYEFAAYFIVNAFAQTATTFTSQNYGNGNAERCKKVYRQCFALSTGMCFAACIVIWISPKFWLSFFTADAAVLAFGLIRMRYVVILEWLTSLNEIPASTIRGMGVSLPPTIISITGSCIFRIIWMLTVFKWFNSYNTLMIVYPVSWVFLAVCMVPLYLIMSRKKLALLKTNTNAML